ncbi:hypothetical protein ABI_02900 [Asticcacaulis biprosthecium C19]|uniref:Sel1 repeat family protein n=1 Tax=Asticcacaulis biprosthecium C19 TaxID=715226 RepID=F4QJ27_9CAUL|nr:hypothetical protein [Asticcacaulis biprosthecium]EGF91858.1 hypothetical protein ABI_02900 [Asticcacaulis biprosthecium C19]
MSTCPPHAIETVAAFEGGLRLTALRARLFDRFLYDGVYEDQAVLVHEFAPQGLVRRTKGGSIVPTEARFDAPYATARDAWQGVMATRHPHLLAVVAAKGNWVITEAPGPRLVDATGDRAGDFAAALKPLAEAGTVLGTLSPDTVFRSDDGVVFAGRAPDYRDLIALTSDSDLAGPAGYAAPEVFDAKKRAAIGPEADMFAASALMLRMITGRDPADVRTGDLSIEAAGAPERVRMGLALSRKARAESLNAWFDGVTPAAPAKPAPTPPPAPPKPAPGLTIDMPPVKKTRIPIAAWVIGAVVAVPLAITAMTVGLDSWKQAATERQTREAREAVDRCRTAVTRSASDAPSQCTKALSKISDTQSPDYSWVAYNLGVMCERRDACAQGKSALDYYRLAAVDRTTVPGKVANYKVAKLDNGLSLADRHDHFAPAAGVLKKPDAAFIKGHRAVYADANFEIGKIFDTWSRQDSVNGEEAQRLSPGSTRAPQKIALISAINRFEVAKTYGVDTATRLMDLYIRRGDGDAESEQYDQAVSAYKRAGALGSADARFKAAELYFAGHTTSVSQADALDLVQAASEAGNTDAELCLAAMRYFGYPDERDTIGGMASFASLTVRGVNNARLDSLACRDWIRRGQE